MTNDLGLGVLVGWLVGRNWVIGKTIPQGARGSTFSVIWSGKPVGACRPGQMAVHLSVLPACDRKSAPWARI